jgi:hypothetical protein
MKPIGSLLMNRFTLVIAFLVAAAAASLAGAPWKAASAADGYSDSLGIAFLYSGAEPLNASNCYDACATIRGEHTRDSAAALHAAQ